MCSLLRPGTAASWQSTFNNYPPLPSIVSDLDDLLRVASVSLDTTLVSDLTLSYPRNDHGWRSQTGFSLSALTSLWLSTMGEAQTQFLIHPCVPGQSSDLSTQMQHGGRSVFLLQRKSQIRYQRWSLSPA